MEIKQWSTDNCRNIIEQIRREQYLIGVELPVEAAKGAESLRNKLNNALKLLAEDLYSKETHFVLELVQNADDNAYPDRSIPTIRFILQQDSIVITNNEIGFEERNLYALCSVGESTKKKRAGFIGEKGIGFKSVFTVSDRPEIHSNGFHFRFDRTVQDELLGYVVPHWCGDNAKLFSESETTIVLPAKKDSTFSTEVLAEVSDELLLFLRKIRRIDIETDNGSRQRCFERTDQGNIVSLSTWDKAESVRRFVHAPHVFSIVGVAEEKRPKISESEIVLAFPVDEDDKAIADSTHPVFAFLPIRDFGFRFLVQGDFLLSSGREDIQKARPWNIKCRDEIAEAFIQTLDFFKSSESLKYTFLNFVPRRSEVSDPFFRTAAESIVRKLSQQPCIQGVSGVWRKPSEALLADEQIRTLIPHAAALRLFGKDYASPRINVAKEVLSLLGCVSLSIDHVIKVFADANWVKEQGAKWIAQFYSYLANKFTTDKEIATLKEAACLLLDGGALVSPAKEEVFFPLEHRRKYGFESELKLIDDDILEAIPAFSEDIRRFLVKLGVRMPDPYSLITNHILPRHSKDEWKESQFQALTGHVRYIKDRLKDYLSGASSKGQTPAQAISVLANGLWLQTKKVDSEGMRWFRRATALYVSHEYEPSFDIEGLLGDQSDPIQFISTDYLPPKLRNNAGDNENAATKSAWREFLLGLGVLDVPRVSPGAADHEPSKELEVLLKSEDSNVRRQTVEMIDRRWSYYSAHEKRDSTGKRTSRFIESLRATVAPTKKKKAVPLSTTYVDNDAIRSIFGDSPVYLDAHVSNPAFLDACEIVHKVDLAACLKRLDQLRTNEKPRLGAVQRIYRQIEQIFDKDEQRTRQAFHQVPRIFVPGHTLQWATVEQVTWTSHGALLDSLFPPLERHYREHQSFFCRRIGVARELPVTALIDALRKLPNFEETAEERRSDALKIYKRVTQNLRERTDSGEPDWIETFRSEKLFLDHMGRLVQADNDLYVDDSSQLSQLFRERKEISFLAVDWPQIPQIQTLLDAVDIPKLSEKTSYQRVPSEVGETELEQEKIIKNRYHILARVVYANSHVAFERATENGAWDLLSRIQVKQVPSLSVEVSLGEETAISELDVFRQDNIIFVRAGARGIIDRLAQEICLLLNVKTSLSDTIYRIISARDESELSDFFEVKGIPEIPKEELLKLKGRPREKTIGPEADPLRESMDSFEDVSRTDGQDEGSGETLEVAEEVNTNIDTSTSRVPAAPRHCGAETKSTDTDHSLIRPAMPGTVTEGWEREEGAAERRPADNGRSFRDRKARSGRLLSYAESARDPNKQSSAADDANKAAERMKVARAAVDFVLEIGRAEEQNLVEMAPNNKGFDIKRVLGDGTEEFIEVKGQRGGWTETGVALTPDELRYAEKYRDHYWLYVVEFAKDVDRRVLHKIQDPFGSTTEFRFDCGWKGLAVTFSNEGLKPATGLKIDIPNVGPGVILSAETWGELYKLHVQLDEGQMIFRVYDPGKMRLYRDN